MKVIKINAIWCSACIIMNKVWDRVNSKYHLETISLDYDFDSSEVEKYNPGNVIPIFIFIDDDKELFRITGEHKDNEMIDLIEKLGAIHEKNN